MLKRSYPSQLITKRRLAWPRRRRSILSSATQVQLGTKTIKSPGSPGSSPTPDSTEISRGSFLQTVVSSPLMAEALAIREALLHASAHHYKRIWLRSDSQGLITAINSNLLSIELYGILSDVYSMISSKFLSVLFSFISRTLNGPADSLAKACLCMNPLNF